MHCTLKMDLLVLFGLLATLVIGILASETNHKKKILKIETGIDQLIYRIIKLENGIDARKTPDRDQGYESLIYRVSRVAGTGCREDFFQCGGNDPQCVNNMFVCDGQKDCRNGADEGDCSFRFGPGETIKMRLVHFECGFRMARHVQFNLTSAPDVLKPVAEVNFEGFFDHYEHHIYLYTTAYYEFATHTLRVTPPASENVGWLVNFNDRTITFYYGASDYVCGFATFP